jgi:hypothetical protein
MLLGAGGGDVPLPEAEPSLVVHEWGTITTKHYANGNTAGGMNFVDKAEALPKFVHHIKDDVLRALSKGQRSIDAHPDVTMRLETPVIYFYPLKAFDKSKPIHVGVKFKGGLLNEFYPDARASYEGIRFEQREGADRAGQTRLTEHTASSLDWMNLLIGGDWPGPATDATVWTAPRQVLAADVKARTGESERYLFYRGVARLHSLFRTRHDPVTREVTLMNPIDQPILHKGPVTVPALWLVSSNGNGKVSFKEFGPLMLTSDQHQILAKVSAGFPRTAYSTKNVGDLRGSVREALISNGLYADEADAMLNTWKHAYFDEKGTRILYIVPSMWADHHLPLSFSVPAEVVRVYIGRIDLHRL